MSAGQSACNRRRRDGLGCMRFRKQKETSYLADPDVACMLALKKGDRHAFEILMHKYYPRILNFVYRAYRLR